MNAQLIQMAKPFPKAYMGQDDKGRDAVDHTVVTQRLLQIVGPYDLEVREVLRSEVPPKVVNKGKPNEKTHPGGFFVTGVVVRLTLELDGRRVSVEEVGGCENAAMIDGDGERMKHAMSDAIKRAAMRLGLGLHMWAQEHFFLYDVLLRDSGSEGGAARSTSPSQRGAEQQPQADEVSTEDSVSPTLSEVSKVDA